MTYSQESTQSITKWNILPSFKYDALCFLNILTGDTFYLAYYQSEYTMFANKLDDKTKSALSSLKRKVKDEKGMIVSAYLCLFFSAVDDSTLDQLVNRLDNTDQLKKNLSQTPYYDDESWKLFESISSDLRIIFSHLKKIEFEQYWKKNNLPKITNYIASIQNELPKYDVIKLNEHYLGYKLPSDNITVYMLYYAQPHGIKITGTRFLTDIAWPLNIVIRTAAHEMMHPPYDISTDDQIKSLVNSFNQDDFVMDKVKNHNPSFGYNSLEGLFEEDCVQSLDQLINEKLGIAREVRKRWIENDDGIHVLAIALYQIMKEENYNTNNEIFKDFLLRVNKSGKFVPGKIKVFYDQFYN